jgi:hypothetical protein
VGEASDVPDLNFSIGGTLALVPSGLVKDRVSKMSGDPGGGSKVAAKLLKKQRLSHPSHNTAKIGGGYARQPPPGTMNIPSVNCRGCGQPEAVQEIHLLVEEKRPAVVFLMETRMGEDRARGLQRSLGFPNAIVVKSEGLSGGLLLLWSPS